MRQFEIRIKELTIFSLTFLFLINHLSGRKIYIDNIGKIYFCFIVVCLIYTLIHLNNLQSIQDIYSVIHILIFTILNFVIYFLVLNINLKHFNLNRFINFFLFIYVIIFAYFVYYSIQLHILGQNHVGGFYTVEHNMKLAGKLKIYIAGPNGKSWFFLILTSFLVGYFQNNKHNTKALMLVLMSLFVSYLMMSRAGLFFNLILLVLYLLTFLKSLNLKKISYLFIVSLFLCTSLFLFYDKNVNNSVVIEALQKKEGFSNRDKLIFDSLKVIENDFFVGRGFHYVGTHKDQFAKEGYQALALHNTQNTLLSITIELGAIGLLIYLTFWILLYSNIVKFIKYSSFSYEQSYLKGVKLMVIFIFFSFFFNHFFEKNFIVTPIYMIFISLAVKLKYYKHSN